MDIKLLKQAQQAEHLRVMREGTPEEKRDWVLNNCGFAKAIHSARKSGKKIEVKFGE